MTTRDRRSRLAWTLIETPNGERELHVELDEAIAADPVAIASVEEARMRTNVRAHGWHPMPDGERPTLPWHPNLSPAEIAWVWIRLLQRYAIAPDITGPKVGDVRNAIDRPM